MKVLHLPELDSGRLTTSPIVSFRVILYCIALQFLATGSFAQYSKLVDFGTSSTLGDSPDGSLISDGTFLYGMTASGGNLNGGNIFKIKPDGTGYVDLYDFDAGTGSTDGNTPYRSLYFDGTFLYGVTYAGGTNNLGTIFKIMPDGTGYTILLNFTGTTNGSNPECSLISDGTFLYGTTSAGGIGGLGTVFKIKPNGTIYTKLHDFSGSDGSTPQEGLLYDGVFLYGTASMGGANSGGTLFKIMPDATNFTKLLDFTGASNGNTPSGSLISDGTFLYGTTFGGGPNGNGTLFKIMPDGTGYLKLLDFDGVNTGANPAVSLISDGTFLYGSAINGGANSHGTVFKIKSDGTGFVNLLNFNSTNGSLPAGTLFLQSGLLYGMTEDGGQNAPGGVLFKIQTDGTNEATMFNFGGSYGASGINPSGSLYSDGTYLYGMTASGGTNANGTLFKVLPDGTGYAELLSFNVGNGSSPFGSVISDGTFLYGMTNTGGGLENQGTIFKVKPDGTAFTTLVHFSGFDGSGVDGSYPYGDFYYDGTYLYGMTSGGGLNSKGTLFKLKPDGTGFTTLVTFDGINKGSSPHGSLISDGSFLYGMTSNGGGNGGGGNIFKLKNDGSGFTVLYNFGSAGDGSSPYGSLVSDGTFLYGMTKAGGSKGEGTVFKINADGTGYSDLLDFTWNSSGTSDGASPNGSLTYDGTFLYGMTSLGSGSTGNTGIMFKIKPDGTGYSKLLDFSSATGIKPQGSLLLAGTTLYGMTQAGGSSNSGTIFKYSLPTTIVVNAQPTDFTVCAGGIATFNTAASGTTHVTYQWQFSPDGIVQFVDISNGGGYSNVTTATLSVNTTGSFGAGVYRCRVNGDFAAQVNTNLATLAVNPLPASPAPSNANNCGPGSVTLTASGGTNGNYIWYDATATVITGQSNSTYTTPVLSSTTNFSVAITNGTCNSLPATVVATINILPTAPTTQGASACTGNTFTLLASGGTNGQYVWYTLANGGTAITGATNSSYTTPSLTTTTTYYVSINNGTCESARTPVKATVITTGCIPPSITTEPLATQIGGVITLNLVALISTPSSTLNLTSLAIVTSNGTGTSEKLASGATASIDASGVVTISYMGISFSGMENISIKACDTNGNCATQQFNIDVAGDIIVYNGVSPNGKNPSFIIQYIDILPDTKNNSVYIFDRWENEVWHGTNYNNTSVVFSGVSDGGGDLPSGVYFYKIDFVGGRKSKSGFISLRR